MTNSIAKSVKIAVLVAALGYFVDIYDLILFSIVRVPSLKDLGSSGEDLYNHGVLLLNMQMGGMLVGGILWGILGDKRGRVKVLFGSILLYSLANLANAFVHDIYQYAALRLLAGIGLAGELGAGITLVAEGMPKEKRGLATALVAAVGISGALLAAFVADWFAWRAAYIVGGGLGLALLLLRIGVLESAFFARAQSSHHRRGEFLYLFRSWPVFKKYLRCILIGIPLWFVVGILMTFAPEFKAQLQIQGEITAGHAIMYTYLGLVFGDLASGLISQWLRSRKRVIFLFLCMTLIFILLELNLRGLSAEQFYVLCFTLGLGTGYWALFVTVAAEQFGTNLRSTVATTVPNFVRGSVVPLISVFSFLKVQTSPVVAGELMGAACVLIAILSLFGLEESFAKDLDYLEEIP